MRFFFSKDHQELNQNLISFYQDLNQERPIPDSDPDSEPESGSESGSESVPEEIFSTGLTCIDHSVRAICLQIPLWVTATNDIL